jgi:hypothetical protein
MQKKVQAVPQGQSLASFRRTLQVLPVTLTKQQKEDTTLLAGLEKYPAFCMSISVETIARLAVHIAARPLENRGLCAGGCGHDVLVTQYRNKGMYELDKYWLQKAQFIPKKQVNRVI